MSDKTIVTGVYGLATQESVGRQFAGVLRYVKDHPNIALHEFYGVTPCDEDEESFPPWKGDVDGILLAVGAGPGIIDWVLRGDVPAVNMVSDIIDPRLPAVFVKPASIAQLAVDHLSECGCRRYLHVGSSSTAGTSIRARAFEQAVAATGCPFTHMEMTTKIEEVTPIAYDALSNAAMDRALTAKPYPVGVLTLNDVLGRLVLARAAALGLETPGQVAVVGVNDSYIAISESQTLTSVHVPGETIGYRAMELLVKQIRCGRRPRKPMEVPATELVVRESTGGQDCQFRDVARAMELIHDRANIGITIEDVLKTLSIPRRTLNEQFQKQFGRSPGEEIQRLRMAHAIDLVVHTDFAIDRISAMLGFEEPTSFTKFFRKRTGMPPTRYRKQRGHLWRQEKKEHRVR